MKTNWFKIKFNFFLDYSVLYSGLLGTFHNFPDFLIYLQQGFKCKDCEKNYYACKCEEYKYNSSLEEISEFVYEWIIYNLSKSKLKKIINRMLKNYKIDFKILSKKEIELFNYQIKRLNLYL